MAVAAPAPAAGTNARVHQLLLALLLCFSAWTQLSVVAGTVVERPLRADAGEYFSYAWNLDHYGSYSMAPTWRDAEAIALPDAVRTPGYPLFLFVAGHPSPMPYWLHRISVIQALLGVATVWLGWLLARAFLGRWLALAAAAVLAINPYLAMSSVYLLSECLFTFLLLASVLLSLRACEPGAAATRALLAGACWGACSLVRPTTEFLPLLLALATFALPALRRWRRPAALALLAFAVVMAPWFARNRISEVGASSTQLMVATLSHGSYPGFMYEGQPKTLGYPYRHDPEYPTYSRDLPSALAHIGGQFRAHPLRYARWYLLGKPYFFLSLEDVQSRDIMIYKLLRSPYYEQAQFALQRIASQALHWPLVLLGLAAMGMLALRPSALRLSPAQRLAASLVAIVVVYAIAFHMVVAPFPRYGLPFRPLLYALALLPLRAAWVAWREPRGAAPNLVA